MNIRTPRGKNITLEPKAEAIWKCLEDGVIYALNRAGTPPDPYTQSIAYRREPYKANSQRRDHYQPWWEVLAQMHGDCEDLSMFLVAYLRGSGIDPTARVALIEWSSGGWHAVVLRYGYSDGRDETYDVLCLAKLYGQGTHIYGGPDIGWDPQGWYIEDPSRRLGMKDSSRGSRYSPLALGDQREPRGESVIGQDPYVPFEIAGLKEADSVQILRFFGGM